MDVYVNAWYTEQSRTQQRENNTTVINIHHGTLQSNKTMEIS